MPLKIDTRRLVSRIVRVALWCQLVALIGDIVFNYNDVLGHLDFRRIFNIAREESFPTWLASAQALGAGVTAAGLWRITGRRGWAAVSAFFVYISVDDAAEVHERVSTALAEKYPTLPFLADYPSFSWHVLVAPVLAGALLGVCIYLWRSDPSRRTRELVLAGVAAFGISQSVDVLEGVDGAFATVSDMFRVSEYAVSHSFKTFEEMLEMLGTLALWVVMMDRTAERLGVLTASPARASSDGREPTIRPDRSALG